MILDRCDIPIVLAPLAGGPSTPELAAAVSNAGGLGFLASGYLSAAELADRRERLEELTDRPFGVNLFVPGPGGELARVREFAAEIEADVSAVGARLGEPRHDDDDWDAKIGYLMGAPAAVVSFTFGLPDGDVIAGLRARGTEVWVTVTGAEQARRAAAAGADLLVVQGYEAGGHQGGTSEAPGEETGLLALLQLVTARLDTPVVAAGGIATGRAIAAVLCLGARAAALGTAFLDCPEAGTAVVHRSALRADVPTRLTRAFSGRTARGIENGFLRAHSASAPAAYPEVHHLTSPMRAAARRAGLADYVNLWAGQAYPLTSAAPAAELVRDLWEQARETLRRLRSLGGQAFGGPVVGGPLVADPVVQAVRGFLPELDAGGEQPEAGPALGAREIGAVVVLLHVLHPRLEGGQGGDDAALAGGGGVAARRRGAGPPVLVGFRRGYRLDGSGHAHLAVDRSEPVQNGRGLRIGGQFGALVAGEVGEEGQPALEAAKYHHPGRGEAIGGRGRDRHGFRHRLARAASGVQPRRQLP
jgi:nitronate monooxygenase